MVRKFVNFARARLRKVLLEEAWLEDYIRMGMQVGEHCSIQPGVIIDASHCWLIKIGNHVTIAPQAYLLAHDASTKSIHNYTKIGSITIEDQVFIGARAIIMPGVVVGAHSIIAAGSVVTKSVPPGHVVAGNPARSIMTLEEYAEKSQQQFDGSKHIYDQTHTSRANPTLSQKRKMYGELRDAIGFIE